MLWAISLPVSAVAMAVTSASQVKHKLEKLFVEKKCMPIMVRLAWHDAGTYSKASFRFLCLAPYPSAGPAWCWLNRDSGTSPAAQLHRYDSVPKSITAPEWCPLSSTSARLRRWAVSTGDLLSVAPK